MKEAEQRRNSSSADRRRIVVNRRTLVGSHHTLHGGLWPLAGLSLPCTAASYIDQSVCLSIMCVPWVLLKFRGMCSRKPELARVFVIVVIAGRPTRTRRRSRLLSWSSSASSGKYSSHPSNRQPRNAPPAAVVAFGWVVAGPRGVILYRRRGSAICSYGYAMHILAIIYAVSPCHDRLGPGKLDEGGAGRTMLEVNLC